MRRLVIAVLLILIATPALAGGGGRGGGHHGHGRAIVTFHGAAAHAFADDDARMGRRIGRRMRGFDASGGVFAGSGEAGSFTGEAIVPALRTFPDATTTPAAAIFVAPRRVTTSRETGVLVVRGPGTRAVDADRDFTIARERGVVVVRGPRVGGEFGER